MERKDNDVVISVEKGSKDQTDQKRRKKADDDASRKEKEMREDNNAKKMILQCIKRQEREGEKHTTRKNCGEKKKKDGRKCRGKIETKNMLRASKQGRVKVFLTNRNILAYANQIAMPVGHVLVGDARGHVKHEDGALSLDVVAVAKTSKLFLTSRVPHFLLESE